MSADGARTDEVESLSALGSEITSDEVNVARVAAQLRVEAAWPDLRVRRELECSTT